MISPRLFIFGFVNCGDYVLGIHIQPHHPSIPIITHLNVSLATRYPSSPLTGNQVKYALYV